MNIEIVLENHKKWMLGEKGGERANLRGADLFAANLSAANLCDADLCGASLRGANLRGANLYGASLRGASLRGANLSAANLCDADLCGASLCDANLCGASLCDASLWHVTGNRKEIISLLLFEEYSVTYTSEYLQIGCERHSTPEWWEFDDKRIIKMGGKTALKFWRKNKDWIKSTIESYPATPTKHSRALHAND